MTKSSTSHSRIRYTVGVDSNWSWCVCFASFLIQFIVLGIQNSFGAFFVEFLNEFNNGESSTAWIGSVSFGLTFMNGPLATAMSARWGSRVITCLGATLSCCGLIMTSFVTSFPWLYITYGLVFGLGSSFCYFASIAGLTSFFKKHLCLAYGITLAGSGVGTPVMILGMEYMISTCGWRSTLRFSAAICSVLFLCGLTYLPFGTSNGKQKNSSHDINHPSSKEFVQADDVESPKSPLDIVLRNLKNVFDFELFKDYAFAIWVVALGFCIFGYFIPFVFVIRIGKDIGLSGTQSTLLIAYLAINQTVFKILFGKLGDFARTKRIIILQVLLFIQAIATMLCPLATKYGYAVLVIYVVLFGVGDGCWSVMVGMGTELIVGKTMMPRAFGCLYGLISVPLILGPPIAGLIFDKTGSYGPAFILAASMLIVGIVLMCVVQRLIAQRHFAEKAREKSAVEVVMNLSQDDEIDDTKGTSNTYVNIQPLVPWRRHLFEEPYSRPSSLIISRLLDDAHSMNEDLPLCTSRLKDLAESQSSFVDYAVLTPSQEPYHQSKDFIQDIDDDEGTQSIASRERESMIMLQHDASGSINSDSGRSTVNKETVSWKSQRFKTGSTDSVFEYDTLSLSSSNDAVNGISAIGEKSTALKEAKTCSVYAENKLNVSINDMFSKLMERALEIEAISLGTKEKGFVGVKLYSETSGEHPLSMGQGHDIRETVL